MITGYTRPQLLIRQLLQRLVPAQARTLNAFVVGPQFDLFRYTNATERAQMTGVAFAENLNSDPATRQLVPYEGLQIDKHIVDLDFAKLYAEQLEGQAWAATSAVQDTDANVYDFVMPSLGTPNKLQVIRRGARIQATRNVFSQITSVTILYGGTGFAPFNSFDQPVLGGAGTGAVVRLTTNASGAVTSAIVVSPGADYTANVVFTAMVSNSGANVGVKNLGTGDDVNGDGVVEYPLIPELHGRPVQAGDVLYATVNDVTIRRTVRSVEREIAPSHYGTDTGKANKQFAASVANPALTTAGSFGNVAAPTSWDVVLANSSILSADLVSGGSGYTSTPDVSVSAPIVIDGALEWPAEEALVQAIMESGTVIGIDVTAQGAGYYDGAVVGVVIIDEGSGYMPNNPPQFIIASPGGTGVQAVVEAVISTDPILGPIYGGPITGVRIVNPGSGYSTHLGNAASPPYNSGLTIVDNGGTGAKIILITNVGSVRSIAVDDPGSGYVADAPAITFSENVTRDASATAYLGLISVAVSAGGSGYHVGDILEVAAPSPDATDRIYNAAIRVTAVDIAGAVTAATVARASTGEYIHGRYTAVDGITSPTTVTGGWGTNATFTLGWGVTEVLVTNPGEAYTSEVTAVVAAVPGATAPQLTVDYVGAPTITISGGGGIGAIATPVTQSVAGDWSGLVEGSVYNGNYGERYTITVTKAGVAFEEAQVRIRSQSGAFSANNVVAHHYGLGYLVQHEALGGVAVELRYPDHTQTLPLGAQFSFVVTGKYKPLDLSSSGQVLAVNIVHEGNYSVLPTTITFSAPPAGGVQATATITGESTAVTIVTITNPGSGYIAPPAITINGTVNTGESPAHLVAAISAPELSRDLSLLQSSEYTGPKDTRYKLEVVQGDSLGLTQNSFSGAVVRVSDSAGIDTIQEYTVQHGIQYSLGTYGLKFVLPIDTVAPGGLVGENAHGTIAVGLDAAPAITAGGSGYHVGDVISITNGTGAGTPARLRVTEVDGGTRSTGVITGISLDFAGAYTALPANLNTSTVAPSGGTAAHFTGTYQAVSVTLSNHGNGYVLPPVITITPDSGGIVLTPTLANGVISFVTVTSAGAGYTSIPTVAFTDPITFQGGLRKGDTYYVDAVAQAKTGPASVIVVNGQIADIASWATADLDLNKFDIDLRVAYSGILDAKRDAAPIKAWEAGDMAVGGILVKDRLAILVNTRDANYQWLPVKNSTNARLYASWRGLVPSTTASRIRLYDSEANIVKQFGIFDHDNPVCYGAVTALRAAQGKAVYAINIPTNDLAGHAAIIRQAERVEGIYSVAPMTMDEAIQVAWQEHIDKVSAPDWKLWRRVYVATQNPGTYAVMNFNTDEEPFQATVTANASGNVRVICMDGDFLTRNILPGDMFRANYSTDSWGDPDFEEYEILSVLENDELILKTGPTSQITPAAKFEIWRPDNGLSQAEFVGNRSKAFADRRVVSVWCDSPILHDSNGGIQYQDLFYVAAEVAGLRSAVLPQQGLTYTELNHALDSAPLMYTKYSQEELNVAAANGTMIITQDTEDGPVFIRHQLTTNSTDGPLYWEDSVGTNLDNISYAVKFIFQPYIGKRNANPEVVEELQTKMRKLLDAYKGSPGGLTQIGPALIDWSNLTVAIDPVFKDRINIGCRLVMPLPLNTLDVTLEAVTLMDTGAMTITVSTGNVATTVTV